MINAQQEIAALPKGITPTIADIEASKIASSVIQHSSYIDSLNVATNAVASYQKVISTALEPMHSYFASIAETVGNASIVMSNMLSAWTQSPFLNWLAGYDFSPILRALETVANFSITHEKIEKYKHHYLLPLYECHWFPYAGLYASFSLLDEIDEILETSRGKSKRRTARIDKAILSYYDDKRIHEIKQRCRKSTMESHVKKMVNQAINAHLRGEYVLTIACLATLWEGMLKQKMPAKTRSNKELKKDIKALVVGNGYEEILGDFYNNLIIGTCYGIEDVKEGVPNRNGIAHSWYKKYPNKKASLNAILLTDFIINLNPKETTEVTENGQTENADSEQG